MTIAYLIHPEGRKGIWVNDFCAVEKNVSNPLNMEVTLLPTESRVNCTTPVSAAAKQEIQKLEGQKPFLTSAADTMVGILLITYWKKGYSVSAT